MEKKNKKKNKQTKKDKKKKENERNTEKCHFDKIFLKILFSFEAIFLY